jgi:hypothetical protein
MLFSASIGMCGRCNSFPAWIASRRRMLKGLLAPYAKRMGIVVVRDAKGRPISYRFTPNR